MWGCSKKGFHHTTQKSVDFYTTVIYKDRWVGTNGPVFWPRRSPDLTKLDFFWWGFGEVEVYLTPPVTPPNIQNRIRFALQSIIPNMLEDVGANFKQCKWLCLQENVRNFEHLKKFWFNSFVCLLSQNWFVYCLYIIRFVFVDLWFIFLY